MKSLQRIGTTSQSSVQEEYDYNFKVEDDLNKYIFFIKKTLFLSLSHSIR